MHNGLRFFRCFVSNRDSFRRPEEAEGGIAVVVIFHDKEDLKSND